MRIIYAIYSNKHSETAGLKQVEFQLKRDWSQSEQGEIEIVNLLPTLEHSFWAAANCNAKIKIDGKNYIFEHLRGTILIEKEDGLWKISHIHTAFPDYRNSDNGSFPTCIQ